MLPNTNITRNQQTAQNPRKRVASDLIEQTSDLSENYTEVNMDISTKKTRYSNSTNENDIPITNITRSQQTTQNPRKRHACDLIRQTSESSKFDTDLNTEVPGKKTQHSSYKTDASDSDTHEKIKKLQKKEKMREYIKEKHMSCEYKAKESLRQKEHKKIKTFIP